MADETGRRKTKRAGKAAGGRSKAAPKEAEPVRLAADVRMVPLHYLSRDPVNVRRTDAEGEVASLADSIYAHGLQSPLSVRLDDPPEDPSAYSVIAGGRRLAALRLLASSGRIKTDEPVPCVLHRDGDDDAAVERASLAENLDRLPMNPVDQLEVFARQVNDRGVTDKQLAAQYGVKPLYVRQRLALARLSPKCLAKVREGKVTMETAEMLTGIDDHDEQDRLVARHGGNSAWAIRREIGGERQNLDHPAVRFVGLKAYKASGGEVIETLFSQRPEDRFIADEALLKRLANEKFDAESRRLAEEEGWGFWQHAMQPGVPSQAYAVPTAEPEPRPETPEEAAERKKLEAELDDLEKRADAIPVEEADGSVAEELYQRMGQIEDALADLGAKREVGGEDAEWRARHGIHLYLDYGGALQVKRAVVPSKQQAKALPKPPVGDSATAADESADRDEEDAGLSPAVLAIVSGERTEVLRNAVVADPAAALDLLLCCLLPELLAHFCGHGPVRIHASSGLPDSFRVHMCEPGPLGGPYHAAVAALAESMPDETREGRVELMRWVAALPQARKLEALALCVAASLSTNLGQSASVGDARDDAMAELLGRLDVDLPAAWRPGETYFGRLKKARIAADVAEATGDEAVAAEILKLKKGDAVARAVELVKPTRWLPAPLRPGIDVVGSLRPAAAEPTAAGESVGSPAEIERGAGSESEDPGSDPAAARFTRPAVGLLLEPPLVWRAQAQQNAVFATSAGPREWDRLADPRGEAAADVPRGVWCVEQMGAGWSYDNTDEGLLWDEASRDHKVREEAMRACLAHELVIRERLAADNVDVLDDGAHASPEPAERLDVGLDGLGLELSVAQFGPGWWSAGLELRLSKSEYRVRRASIYGPLHATREAAIQADLATARRACLQAAAEKADAHAAEVAATLLPWLDKRIAAHAAAGRIGDGVAKSSKRAKKSPKKAAARKAVA